MYYEKDVPCPERKEAVFETIKQTLLPLSFRIIQENDTVLELKSSGSLWISGQNPLMGISDITVHINSQNMKVVANLGGLTKAIWYLVIFLLFMVIFFIVVFGATFGFSQKTLRMCLAPFSVWPILTPIMYFFMKSRTYKALDIMLGNAAGRDV
jgi:hypothetical protein